MEKKIMAEIHVIPPYVSDSISPPRGATKVNKVVYYDSSAEAMEYRFQKIRDFYTALERQTALDLGFSLTAYMTWRDKN